MPIKLLIVDDQRLIRQCFERVLASDPEIEIVGSAMDGTEAVLRGVECQPDVVLMDFSMPGMNGVEATRMLHERVPRAKVLILSMHGQGHQVSRAMREGIAGYIVKDVPAGELIRIIKAVHHGERVESGDLMELFQKLGVKNRTEAAIRALELGLVDPSVPDSRGAPRAQ
jgi:DNA-binding NarL/FixJ family response regulator